MLDRRAGHSVSNKPATMTGMPPLFLYFSYLLVFLASIFCLFLAMVILILVYGEVNAAVYSTKSEKNPEREKAGVEEEVKEWRLIGCSDSDLAVRAVQSSKPSQIKKK